MGSVGAIRKKISIDDQFITLFEKLETTCDAFKNRVNGFTETGKALDEKLSAQVEQWQPLWEDLAGKLWELDSSFDEPTKKRHRLFVSNSSLIDKFRQAPYYERIITKPEGYAGDAEMMNIIYRHQYEGAGPFARFLHKTAVNCKACRSVRNRRELLKEEILKTGSGNILSLAAGPAREIQDVLAMNQAGNNFDFLALDHDINTIKRVMQNHDAPRLTYALANAFNVMKGRYAVMQPRPSRLDKCDPVNDFKGLRRFITPLKYRISRLKKRHYSLVYSAGLYDYIKTYPMNHAKGSTALTQKLFELVQPGGRLIIGNFNPFMPADIRFAMEYICDWNLIYRDKKQMMDFTQTIPDDQMAGKPTIVSEPMGLNYFLIIEKVQ